MAALPTASAANLRDSQVNVPIGAETLAGASPQTTNDLLARLLKSARQAEDSARSPLEGMIAETGK